MKKALLSAILILSVSLAFAKKPWISAGPDQTIAAGKKAQLAGQAEGVKTVEWVTSGSGKFSNRFILKPTYTPSAADIKKGKVSLTLYNRKKPKMNDVMVLRISGCTKAPTVNAGPDILQCGNLSGGEISLNATAANATEITWTTNGSGTFSNPNIFNPSYFYDINDVNLAAFELYATVKSGTCPSYTDTVKVAMQTASELVFPFPSVSQIGSEAVTAEVYVYGPNTDGYWSTSGSGSFSDLNGHVTAYFPSTDDALNGCVQLIFTTYDPEGVCGPVSGSMSACFNAPCVSIVDAGGDMTICGYESGGSVSLSASLIGNAEEIMWSTSGNGGFDNSNSLNTTYYYDASDVNNAYVDLYVSAMGSGCSSSDAVRIYLQAAPSVQFPEPSVYNCSGQPVYANVYLYGYASSGSWYSTGSGTFSDPNSTYSTYYPSEYEGNTCVELIYVTNDPEGPCGPASGSMSACFYDCGFGSSERKGSEAVNAAASSANATVSLYPNPARDKVTLSMKQEMSLSQVYLTDVNGKRYVTELNTDNTLDISQLIKGMYCIHMQFANGDTEVVRFVKQ